MVENSITARCLNQSVKTLPFRCALGETVSICVFKVKYDGREIPCDYTEPVLSRLM